MIEADKSYEITYIDASSACKFNMCPARYFFERLLGAKHPDSQMMIAPDFGTDIHKALPLCYNGVDRVDEAVSVFKESWEKRNYEFDKKRNVDRARAMLENFADCHTSDICPYDILHFPGIVAPTYETVSDNEIPFLIDIGANLLFAGRIDLPIMWRATGQIWAVDYKTASEMTARYFSCFDLAYQTVGYTIALSHLTRKKVEGMAIEALRVSHVNAETTINFSFVTEYEMESFVRQMKSISNEILEANEKKCWKKKFSGCNPYATYGFPARVCEYQDICKASDWKDAVRYYKIGKPFHPFKIKENKYGKSEEA